MTDDKREALAALEHEQWAHWTRYMLKTLEPLLSPNVGMPAQVRGNAEAALERWLRQINTPYADLSEKEKDSDREWADKVLEVVGVTPTLSERRSLCKQVRVETGARIYDCKKALIACHWDVPKAIKWLQNRR